MKQKPFSLNKMKRKIIYKTDEISVSMSFDPIDGTITQLFDLSMIDKTPQGDGLMLEHSDRTGITVNYTGFSNNLNIDEIMSLYIVPQEDI